MEDNFHKLLKWTEKLTKMRELVDLDAREQQNWNASMINDQFNNFPCLSLEDEALTKVKNTKMQSGVHGVACWWKFNHDCRALAGQRIQALANVIHKPHKVKKYGTVIVTMEKSQRSSGLGQ